MPHSKIGARHMRSDNFMGICFMALGMFLFSAVDTMAKFLSDGMHPIQIVWFRQLGLLCGVIVFLLLRGPAFLISKQPLLQVMRGVTAAGSACLFVMALRYVPLADAAAVSFVAPFIVIVLGVSVLKEKVGLRRWISVVLGFVGTLIVIRPGQDVLHPAVFLVVGAAFFFACRQVLSRFLSHADPVSTTVAYTAITSMSLITLMLPFVWRMPDFSRDGLLLVAMSILAALGEFSVIKALSLAQAVVVAPVQYSLIIWSTFYGYLVFAQIPDFWTAIGTLIIVASGIYALRRQAVSEAA